MILSGDHPLSKRFGVLPKNLLALCLELQYPLVGAAVLAAQERRVPFAAGEGGGPRSPTAEDGRNRSTETMTRRLTMAQAVIRFLKVQQVSRDGSENPFFAGCFGIFGHGNVAGIGQALQQNKDFPYYLCRNE